MTRPLSAPRFAHRLRMVPACLVLAMLAACGGGSGSEGGAKAGASVLEVASAEVGGALIMTVTVDGRRLESSENIHLVPPVSTVLLACSRSCEFTALEQDGALVRDASTTSTTWTGSLSLARPISRLTVHARSGGEAPVSVAFMTPVIASASQGH